MHMNVDLGYLGVPGVPDNHGHVFMLHVACFKINSGKKAEGSCGYLNCFLNLSVCILSPDN